MKFPTAIFFGVASIISVCGEPGVSFAQSASSGGITIAITKASPNQREAILQFIATNKTKTRIYLLDAWAEGSQKAFLGSGAQLQWPSIVGIEQSQTNIRESLAGNIGLERYSYIEPGEALAFSFTYQANSIINPEDTISFNVTLVERESQSNGNPSEAGPPHPLRFPFVHVLLNRP